jgi:NAD(P)-dependent dehydrogenase (short-subunit alcohol dehydrogenase family)
MTSLNTIMKLNGRRALITGACGSLGYVISKTLAELGADLVLVDQNEMRLTECANSISSQWAVDVKAHCCDLESESARNELISEINMSGRLDVLVNCAAFVGAADLDGWSVPFAQQSIQTWRRALEVNLVAIFHLCQGLAHLLGASGHGSVINIASIYGQCAPDWGLYQGTDMGNPAAYSASKGGLLQLTRWLATTMAPRVRVNAISPGGIARGQPQQFIERYEAKTPLGRMASEEDMRGVIAFLATDMSSYVLGQNLIIDGGWSIW